MPWDVNQINQMFMGQVLGNSPAEAFDKGVQDAYNERITRENNEAIRLERQRALLRAQQKADDQQMLSQSPTAENYSAYFLKYPEDRESAKQAWDAQSSQHQQSTLRTLNDLRGYMSSGNSEQAAAALRARIAAEKAAGQDTADEEELLTHIVSDPGGALSTITGMIAMVSDPTKAPEGIKTFADTAKAEADTALTTGLTPSKVREAEAVASKAETEARYAPAEAESDLRTAQANREKISADIRNMAEGRKIEWARLNLDQDKLTTQTELALETLYQNGAKPDAGSVKVMNEAAASAVTANALATRATDLAQRIKVAGMSAGPFATAAEAYRRATGGQNTYTQLRSEVTQMLNKMALEGRANMPGAMSDADRKFLLQGFPPANASPTYVAAYLETLAKAQASVARAEENKTSWIGANGNLGPSKRDMEIGGYQIAKGTTFPGFMNYINKRATRNEAPPAVGTLLQKYGGGQ